MVGECREGDAKVDEDNVGENGEADAGIIFGVIIGLHGGGGGGVVGVISLGVFAVDAIVKVEGVVTKGSFESWSRKS